MLIIGHRGARNEAPENTLVGFEHLRSLNIHDVELDIRLSKDNQLMVIHDSTMDRTTNCKGKLNRFTANEMAACNAGSNFQPVGPHGTKLDASGGVPTLEAVIKNWPQLNSIQLEVKSTQHHDLEIIAERLSFLIAAHQIHRQAIITSSDTAMLQIVANQYRHISRGFVAERFRRDPIGICLSLGCEYLVADWRRCSEKFIQQAKRAGLQVSVWTVNRADIALKLFHWGADSIITDEPTKMQKLFYHHFNQAHDNASNESQNRGFPI
ncbi:MAG: glycerophosphodiester phosphodiesterase [Pseudomonadales bacterium]|nr:glycerophosphodiester phosphodiesterase [Pseudomonadales bacterium]